MDGAGDVTPETTPPVRPDAAPLAASPEALDKVLRLLGLGMRARGVVVGVDRVRDAAKHDELVLAVVASDASAHSQDKVRPLLAARRIPTVNAPAADLGAAVGREGTAAVGVTDPHLGRGILMTLGVAFGDVRGAPDRARGGRRPSAGPRARGRTRRTD